MSVDTAVVLCDRCGSECRFTGDRNPEARVLRRSAVPKGLCVNCAVASFFQTTDPLPYVIDKAGGPEVLLLPAAREQFARIMAAGIADADPAEIDWQKVVDGWSLPFPKSGGGGGGESRG